MSNKLPDVNDGFKHTDESFKDERLEKGLVFILIDTNILSQSFLGIGD